MDIDLAKLVFTPLEIGLIIECVEYTMNNITQTNIDGGYKQDLDEIYLKLIDMQDALLNA